MPVQNMKGRTVLLVASFIFLLSSMATHAQDRYEAGAQVALAHSGEFHNKNVGIGGRFTWRPVDLLGVEAEMTFYPQPFRLVGTATHDRLEGMFGVTVGPKIGRVRPFAKLRPGFLTFRGREVACILIFPPPLACVLAGGRTSFIVDVGGGIQVVVGTRTFVRADVGDRVVRYPGPSIHDGRVSQGAFFGQDFRISAGVGMTF